MVHLQMFMRKWMKLSIACIFSIFSIFSWMNCHAETAAPQIIISFNQYEDIEAEDEVTASYQIIGDEYEIESARWAGVNGGSTKAQIDSPQGTCSFVPGWGGKYFFEIVVTYGEGKTLIGRSDIFVVKEIDVNIEFQPVDAERGDTLIADYAVIGANDNYVVETYWFISLLTTSEQINTVQVEEEERVPLSGSKKIMVGRNFVDISLCVHVSNRITGRGQIFSEIIYIPGQPETVESDAVIGIQLDCNGIVAPGRTVVSSYEITGQNVSIQQAKWVCGGWSQVNLTALAGTSSYRIGYSGECYFEITIKDNQGQYICTQSDILQVKDIEVTLAIDNRHVFAGNTVCGRYSISGDTTDYYIETFWMLDIWPNGYGTEVDRHESGRFRESIYTAPDGISYLSFCVSVTNTKTGSGRWYHDTISVCCINHLDIQPGIAPTEEQSGYTASKYCSSCGKVISETVMIPAFSQGGVIRLNEGLECIAANSFEGTNCVSVIIPATCVRIDARAFANCKKLLYVSIPSITEFDPVSVFDGCGEVFIDIR